jgi:ectoine hydroxylase-related dioxygenase (phytanoyl-CoA dioxygenase family)
MAIIREEQVEQFRESGYLLTDVAFDTAQLQAMADEMDRVYQEHLAAARASGDADRVAATRGQRAYAPFHTMSDVAAEFVKAPVYLELCRKLIGPDADLYYNQAATKPPTRGRIFGWHQDSGYTETTPLAYITCWTAIADATLENGCVWVIPGSHEWGLLPHVVQPESEEEYGGKVAQFDDDSAAIPVPMKAGQVACFSSLTLHRSGPNTSDTVRRGFVPQYHVPGVHLADGSPFGDQWPVLRDGERVDVPLSSGLLASA